MIGRLRRLRGLCLLTLHRRQEPTVRELLLVDNIELGVTTFDADIRREEYSPVRHRRRLSVRQVDGMKNGRLVVSIHAPFGMIYAGYNSVDDGHGDS